MKKILFYTDTSYYSGAEIYFSRLVDFAHEDGYEIDVVVSPALENISHELWKKVRALSGVKFHFIATGNKLNFLYFFKLKRLIQKTQPDFVICNMWSPFSNSLLLLAAWVCKKPVLAFEHFFQEKVELKWPLRPLKLLAYNYKKALVGRFVSVSLAHKKVLVQQFGFDPTSISIVSPGVPHIKRIVKKENKCVELVFSGSLEPRKNPIFLLEALSEVKATNWHLSIMGKGEMRDEIQNYIDMHGLGRKVSVLGWVDRPGEVMAKADILLHPALSENYSGVLVEATSLGIPVIANNVGGNGEIVLDKKTGLIIENDKLEWSRAIGELISNTPLRTKMGQSAFEYFSNNLTTATMKKKFLELLSAIK